MRIKRKDANVVKICEASQVKVKTAGDTTVIQFCAGQNKIANDVIVDIWSKGFTDTHAVFEGDGLALYFKAYLSDV